MQLLCYCVILRTPLTVTVFLPSADSVVTVSFPSLSFSVVTVVVTPLTVFLLTLFDTKFVPPMFGIAPPRGLPNDLDEKVLFSPPTGRLQKNKKEKKRKRN